MSKYVPDISTRRWVILSPNRLIRPDENGNKKKKNACPFCPGNEDQAPDELYRVGKGEKNKKGWKVRVVSNRYPITDIHEVIIHTPDCNTDLKDLSESQFKLILETYRSRFNAHKKDGQVLIFCNHGEHAGASIAHSHSQLVVIPSQINLDLLNKEPLNNIVSEDKHFSVYCPDFSQWPYELWILPKKEKTVFGDSTDAEIDSLSDILKKTLMRLHEIYKKNDFSIPFGYNFYINPKEGWYLRLTPRFTHRAGLELGTGLSVNIIDPIEAALAYKGIDTKMQDVLSKLQRRF